MFNEILRCRMKSKRVWMKSSAYASDEIKSVLSPRESGISPKAIGFIPSQRTDLVEKATIFCQIL